MPKSRAWLTEHVSFLSEEAEVRFRIPSSIFVLRRTTPLDVAELVEALGIPVGLILRKLTEGRAYNVALSSFLGERAVGQYLAIVAQLLQWEEDPQGIVLDPKWHQAVAAFAAAVGRSSSRTGMGRRQTQRITRC